jgi:hypothetical protein
MTIHRRFTVDENGTVIDTINPANTGKISWDPHDPEGDRYLRERILWERLCDLTDKLIVNRRPVERLPTGAEYRPRMIPWVIFKTILASHLNTFDPWLSVQNPFDGKPRHEKVGMNDFTSLSLFIDDVESLLRDLYGEIESESLDRLRSALFFIVQEFLRYVRPDLEKEHSDAWNCDYVQGIGVAGCGIHGHDHSRAMVAADNLVARVREVRANPSAFSEYTVEFVRALWEEWPFIRERGTGYLLCGGDGQ